MKHYKTNKGWLFVFIVCLFAFATVPGQKKPPRFEKYPVSTIFSGRNAVPIIKGDAWTFRTRIRNGAKAKRNFAGEYVITLWGCGTTCLHGAVINVRTGKAELLPFTVCCWSFDEDIDPIEFRLNSRLIIFSGLRNESDEDKPDNQHYYEFRNGNFIFLRTVKRKATDAST